MCDDVFDLNSELKQCLVAQKRVKKAYDFGPFSTEANLCVPCGAYYGYPASQLKFSILWALQSTVMIIMSLIQKKVDFTCLCEHQNKESFRISTFLYHQAELI